MTESIKIAIQDTEKIAKTVIELIEKIRFQLKRNDLKDDEILFLKSNYENLIRFKDAFPTLYLSARRNFYQTVI